MHAILAIFLMVFSCSALFFSADLSGSSFINNVSGCWSGKISKSLSEASAQLVCGAHVLSMQWSSVEISYLGYAHHRVSRLNNPQVSALFMEEGKYAR